MKKIIYEIPGILVCALALFIFASCEGEKPAGEPLSPNFPEIVTESDIVPGTELTLTIVPNMDWTVSIPVASYKWFKILDGRFEVQTLSGKASDSPLSIKIRTTDEESFALRSCEVTMTMGGQTDTIAIYSLQAKERVVEVYCAAVAETGKFVISDGKYQYEEDVLADDDLVELVWDANEGRYYFPLKVKSNYEWSVEWPDWLRADINVGSKVGDACFEIYGISSMLPLEDMTGEVMFKNGDDVMAAFKVRIPGSVDKFSFGLGGYTSLNFDHAAYFHSETGGSTKDPVQGVIFGPSASRVEVVELTDDGYVVPEVPWLDIEVSSWDDVEGADVLQTRTVEISAPRYFETTDRNAIVLFLPATAPADVADIFESDRIQVKEEYSAYVVRVVQTGRPENYFTFEEEESEREAAGIFFEKSTEPLLAEKGFTFAVGASDWQYNLSYVREIASAKSTLYITEPFESTVIYDSEGNEVTEGLTEHWLSFSLLGEGLYGQIVMDESKIKAEDSVEPVKIDGYIVFKDDEGKVLSVVHCFYEAEVKTEQDVLEDVGSTMFRNPSAASAAGASIHKVISGPTYERWKETSVNIYRLVYTENDTSLELNTSKDVFQYQCAGKWSGPEMVCVDEDDYDESQGYVLTWDDRLNKYVGSYDGITSIRMTYTESYTETIQLYDDENAVLYLIICELKIK